MFLALPLLSGYASAEAGLEKPGETPELEDILYIIRKDEAPSGVVMHTREYDEAAFYWVAPRLEYYVLLIRKKFPALPLVILSHGDEIRSLTTAMASKYADVHSIIRRLVEKQGVDFQICGAYAAMNDLDESAYPGYVNVIPSAPTALSDYRDLGYEMISIELTW
jgi:intracellular sulfur oxidation DsrE/DsrF family protein